MMMLMLLSSVQIASMRPQLFAADHRIITPGAVAPATASMRPQLFAADHQYNVVQNLRLAVLQ